MEIGFVHQKLEQDGLGRYEVGEILGHGCAIFLHPAQNISLYTISLGNVSDSLESPRASKSCRRDALKGTTRVGETLALKRGEAGYKEVTKFVTLGNTAEPPGYGPNKGEQGQRL
ncbi:MAG: hypothetical protein DMG93_05790 [Acidobacteria bacterium]|nr:MAG: hypothetical protein DMG93_05790 [Acidobacteriota bacterium]